MYVILSYFFFTYLRFFFDAVRKILKIWLGKVRSLLCISNFPHFKNPYTSLAYCSAAITHARPDFLLIQMLTARSAQHLITGASRVAYPRRSLENSPRETRANRARADSDRTPDPVENSMANTITARCCVSGEATPSDWKIMQSDIKYSADTYL